VLKKKTSKKPGVSPKSTKQNKNRSLAIPYSPSEQLKNKNFVARALIECLQDGDAEAFKEILGAHLDVINKTQFAAKTRIPERTLYRMVSEQGNPTLDNIARVVHALCA
jgi:probable addiction module antidote protein